MKIIFLVKTENYHYSQGQGFGEQESNLFIHHQSKYERAKQGRYRAGARG